jgi:hypothetical protein
MKEVRCALSYHYDEGWDDRGLHSLEIDKRKEDFLWNFRTEGVRWAPEFELIDMGGGLVGDKEWMQWCEKKFCWA